jgi:hypothetical protein
MDYKHTTQQKLKEEQLKLKEEMLKLKEEQLKLKEDQIKLKEAQKNIQQEQQKSTSQRFGESLGLTRAAPPAPTRSPNYSSYDLFPAYNYSSPVSSNPLSNIRVGGSGFYASSYTPTATPTLVTFSPYGGTVIVRHRF